jgi:drug/metabolite transporter (DMT)-like permease
VFGVWPSLSKLAVSAMHPIALSFYVQLLPALLLLPFLRRHRPSRRDWRLLLGTALAGAVSGPIIYFYGLERSTASNSVLLSNSEALFTMIFAYALLKERTSRRGYVALAGIAVGAFFVATQLRFGDVRFLEFLLGNVLLVTAAACWALSNTGSTVLLRRFPIVPLLAFQLLIGSTVLFPIAVGSGVPLGVPVSVLPVVLVLSLTAVVVFSVLFFYAFRTIGAMRTGAVLPSSALWGVLLALYLFPEQALNEWQILGGALMVGSLVALYVFGEPRARPAADETLKPAVSDGPDSP